VRLACVLVLLAGCAHVRPAPSVVATAALVETPAWHTQSSQHRVTVTVDLDGGKHETRTLRGIVAVERPDRLRLAALGPAGIKLFDLLVRNGQPKIISAIRAPDSGPGGQALADVIASLASDLACAYDLAPVPSERHVRAEDDSVIVEEPGRWVRLSRFAGKPATWRRAEIKAAKYRVIVEVDEQATDVVLDADVFAN
jgi:hypothetical protein